jgi:AcrR family transcriptional regulator
MLTLIEDQFATIGRTPKGTGRLRAIFRATRRTVMELGLQGASLDLIADRAGLTQAAVRHYFPTRDELLSAFFISASEWFRGRLQSLVDDAQLAPQERLERCITVHLEFMEHIDTAIWLESSAYWLRTQPQRGTRDDWYRWLEEQYACQIVLMQPALGPRECQRRAYLILTLVLGAWITHGRGSAVSTHAGVIDRRQLIVDTAINIAAA